jgi:hypothetical protein
MKSLILEKAESVNFLNLAEQLKIHKKLNSYRNILTRNPPAYGN